MSKIECVPTLCLILGEDVTTYNSWKSENKSKNENESENENESDNESENE